MSEILILAAAGFISSAVSAMVGFGGGAMLMAVVLVFMPPAAAIPFHALVQLAANSSRVVLLRQWVAWDIVVPFLVLLLPGAFAGRMLFEGLSERVIFVLIGVFVLATLFSQRIAAVSAREYPRWFFLPLGFVIGVLGSTVGVVGLMFAPFLMRQRLSKEGINATMASMAAAVHIVKIGAFATFGFDPRDYLWLLAAMIPAVVVGSIFGKAVLVRFSERIFRILFTTVLVGLAVKMILWDGVLAPLMR